MKYDFETVLNRYELGSVKWKRMYKDKVCDTEVRDVVPMSMADMEFIVCPKITDGIAKFLNKSVLGYTSSYKDYQDAVVGWMKRKHNWNIKPDWIINTPGVVTGFTSALRALLKPGDGVVVSKPIYYPMITAIKDNNLKEINIPLINNNENYKFDIESLKYEVENTNVKALLFCSPHNPTGKVWTRKELEQIAEICVSNNIIIICDEIWNDIIMPGFNHTVFANLSEQVSKLTITCTSPSKTFNIAGLKVSNIIVSDLKKRKLIINELKHMTANSVNILGYKACELAYNNSEEWLDELITVIYKNRIICESFFGKHKLPYSKSEGTYIFWVDLSPLGLIERDLDKFLKKEALIYGETGSMFGIRNNQYIRLNIAMPTKHLENQLKRLDLAIEKL